MGIDRITLLQGFLKSRHFSRSSTNPMLLISRIKQRLELNLPIKIIYGETYDTADITIDSLKYYLSLHILAQLIQMIGGRALPILVTADTASILNDSVKNKAQVFSFGKDRINQIQNVSARLKLNLNPMLMSNLFEIAEHKYPAVQHVFNTNLDFKELILQTIPTDKIKEEEKKGFQYALEEVALISEFDIKLGPPRERFYDQAAYMVNQALGKDPVLGIYLKPSFPFGMSMDSLLQNKNLATFGLTPYKSKSYGLEAHRIILGVTPLETIKELIAKTPRPNSPNDPDPLFDLFTITRLAQRVRTNDFDFSQPAEVTYNPDELYTKLHQEVLQYLYD